MRLRLLGPLELGTGAVALGPRDRVVISALAMRLGEPLDPEQLADALWAGDPPATWVKVVQGCVSRLRRTLGAQAIQTTVAGYRLDAGAVQLDRDEFEELVRRGRDLVAVGAPERAAAVFAQALALWRGRPLDELEEWPPGRVEAARLSELRLTVQEDELQARLDAGEHREVAEVGAARTREEPLRERRWAILALAQYRCGRQADALASIRTARRVLGRELGLDPGSGLVALERAILEQDPSLEPEEGAGAAALECPWKGLASYTADDEHSFHGRGAEIEALVARLDTVRLLVLAGPSGSGKSSVLNAGLAPALRRRGLRVSAFSPGPDGHASMALVRAGAPGDRVLLIDQLEEAFAVGDESAAAWLAEVAAYAESVARVVVALRADQLAHLTLDPTFARLAERGMHLVLPLSGDALREAIEEPARMAGLRLEPGLVDLLLRDAEDQPGALPLLAHALSETWQRRVGRLLTVDAYAECGGLRGAVAASADRLYENLTPDERVGLRWLLLRMVTLDDNGEPVRSALPHSVVGEDRRAVLGMLVRARLVTSGAESSQLAHEALVRAWPRLRAWLDEDKAGQRIARHLSTTAWGWDALGRPDSELYQGARLTAALELRSRPEVDLTAQERAFLDASEARADDERRRLELEARRQRTQNRRLRALLAGAAALLLVAVAAGAVAVDRGRAAGRERDTARASQQAAQHESLVGRSLTLRSTNRSAAALLAVEAFRRHPDALARSALLGTFTASPGFLGYRYLEGASLNAALVPGTQRAVVAGAQSHLGILDVLTGRIRHPFGPPVPGALDYSVIRVSADGQRVAQLLMAPPDPTRCGSFDSLRRHDGRGCSTLVVHDVATGRRVLGPVVTPFSGGDVAINQDGSLVAVTGGLDGDLATYDVSTGRLLGVLPGLPRPDGVFLWRDTGAAVFDTADHVYLGSMRGPVREVVARSLRVVRTLHAPRLSTHNALVLTRTGLLVGSGDQAQVALDVRTGRQAWSVDLRHELFPEPCPFFAVAEGAGRTYCGNYFGQLEERDLATGDRTGVRLDPQLGSVGDLAVVENREPSSQGDELIAFAAGEAAYSRWRLDGSGPAARLVGAGSAAPVGYDPSGRYLVLATGPEALDGVPRTVAVDAVTREALADVPRADALAWVAPGTLAHWGAHGGGLLDVASGRDRSAPLLDRHPDQVYAEPDGRHAWTSTAGPGRTVLRRFALSIGRQPGTRIEVPGYVQSLAVAPGGRTVLVTYADDVWRSTTYDVATGRRLGTGMTGQVRAVVSSTGRLVAADPSGDVTEFGLRDLTPVASLPGSRGGPSSLQFDAAGRTLVVTTADQTVQVYDVATRARLGDALPSGARNGMVEGWLRPDGDAVAVNGPEGVLEWTIEPQAMARAACALAGRNLTPTEWSTYLGANRRYRRTCSDYPTGSS